MTNYIVKVQTDTAGVIDSHLAYVSAESVAEAESKVLAGLKFAPLEREIPATEDEEARTETIEVKVSVTGIDEFPANSHLIA